MSALFELLDCLSQCGQNLDGETFCVTIRWCIIANKLKVVKPLQNVSVNRFFKNDLLDTTESGALI